MKKFTVPEVEITEFSLMDVITTSNNGCSEYTECGVQLPDL